MNKKRFRQPWLPLALALTLTATACSSGGNTPEAPAAPSNQETPGTAGESIGDEVVELTMLVNHPWWPFKDWTGKIPEEITKRTGVKLNIQVAVDDKQLPLMIASGDLPDLVYTASDLTRMAHPDVSHAWNDLIAEYVPDFEIEQSRIGVNTQPDGNFYTILNGYATEQEWKDNPKALPGGSGMALRQDILDELGNPELNTLDDFVNLLSAVKEKHPEMTPLVFDKDQIGQFFRINFGIKRNSGFVDQDGQAVHFMKDPNYIEYYLYMNRLYREGFMTSENFTFKDAQQDDQMALNGQAFAHGGGNADTLNAQLETLGKEYTFHQIGKLLSDKAALPMSGSGWSGVYITKNNSNPQKSIEFLEFMMSEEGQRLGIWGVEGEDWTWNEADSHPVMNYDMNNADFQKEHGIVYWGLLASSGVTEALQRYDDKAQQTPWGLALREIQTFNPALGLVVTKPDTEEQTIEAQLQNLVRTEELKIYMAGSEEEARAQFEDMMGKMERMGLPQLEAWATEEYHAYQENF